MITARTFRARATLTSTRRSPITTSWNSECGAAKYNSRSKSPPNFARDVKRGRSPRIGAWLDGAMPFRAETARGYVKGLHESWLKEFARRTGSPNWSPPLADIQVCYRYNQDFKSIYAMVPSTIALLLVFIPAVLMAVAVVGKRRWDRSPISTPHRHADRVSARKTTPLRCDWHD